MPAAREVQIGEAQPAVLGSSGRELLDLRGGKTVSSKKGSKARASSKSKGARASSSGRSKSDTGGSVKKAANKPKRKNKDGKPTLKATIKAFFVSLINPRFVLKLEAKKKDQIHTVHGSAPMTGS